MVKSVEDIDRYNRHAQMMRDAAPYGTTIYSLAIRSRDGNVIGGRFFVVKDNAIKEITSFFSTVCGNNWDNSKNMMRTRTISDAVDYAGIKMWDELKAYKHKKLGES